MALKEGGKALRFRGLGGGEPTGAQTRADFIFKFMTSPLVDSAKGCELRFTQLMKTRDLF